MEDITEFGFVDCERYFSRNFRAFDPVCSLGVMRLGKPLNEPIEVASGCGETDDLRFEFQIHCENRILTGNMCVVVKDEDKVFSSSCIRTVFPSSPDGIIAVWKMEEGGIARDVIMVAREGSRKGAGRFHLFAGEVYVCDAINFGGELEKGYITIEKLDADTK